MKYFISERRKNIIIIGTIFLLVLLAIMFISYKQTLNNSTTMNEQRQEQNMNIAETEDDSSHEKSSLEVRVGLDEKVVIPNPATAEGNISVSLMNEASIYNICCEKSEAKYSNCLADLSFAGFDKPVFVSSYAIGDMTGTSDLVSHISLQTNDEIKTQEIYGSCLALIVTTGTDNFKKLKKNGWCIYFYDYYLVILDYKNGIYYKKIIDLNSSYLFDRWLDLSLVDLTGDGALELIAADYYSKGITYGVYHANPDTHKIKEIYSSHHDFEKNKNVVNNLYGDFIDRVAFEGKPLDSYKVTLKFPCIGYSTTVSMITDGGYKKSQLQKKRDGSFIYFNGLWKKNGKLRKKWSKKYGNVFLYTLDDISCVKTEDGTMQIELVRSVCVGHRAYSIGHMHTYLEYDNDSDALVIKNTEYVDAKTAKKERHAETWGKLTFR